MNKEDVKLYGNMFKELGLTELKVRNKESEFLLKKEVKVVNTYDIAKDNINDIASNNLMDVYAVKSTESAEDNKVIEVANDNGLEVNNSSEKNAIEITAPLVGVFYAAPSPDAEPFVKVGDRINKGDVVCVIEAMKMFNEITSDVDGTVAEICIDNGNIVEYGQVIMKIEK